MAGGSVTRLVLMLARAHEWRRLDEVIARDLWVRHQVDDALCDDARDRVKVLRALHGLIEAHEPAPRPWAPHPMGVA